MRELVELSFSKEMLQGMDFRTLKAEKTDFIDNELGHNHCDILFSIQYKKQKSYLYQLLEHQTKVDHFIVTRMLKYMCHIYEMHAIRYPKSKKIPLIFPLIIFAGQGKYTAAKSLWELSEHPDQAKQFFPMSSIKVIDLQQAEDEELNLDKYHRIGFLFYIMKSIFSKDLYRRLKKVEVTIKLLAKENKGLKFIGNALCYTMTTADDINKKEKLIELFASCIPQKDKGKFMTIANQFRKEGIKEGMEKERAAIISNMLESNMTVADISKITKLSPEEIKKLQRNVH